VNTFLQINILLAITGFCFIQGDKLVIYFQIKLPSVKVLRFAQILLVISFALPMTLKLIPSSELQGSKTAVLRVYSEDLTSEAPLTRAKVQTARLMRSTKEVAQKVNSNFSLHSFAISFWILGSTLAFGFFVRNLWRIKKLIKNSTFIRHNKKLKIVVSTEVFVPFSVQLRSRWVVLPEHLLANKKDLDLAIKHELQHHRQGDCLWAMCLEFVGIFFFFNPAFGWWKNIIVEQQEYSCDEALTGQAGVSSQDYGSCLIRVAETALLHRQMYVGTTSMAAIIKDSNYFKKFLLRRILMITEDKTSKRTWMASIMALSLASLTIGLAIGAEKIVRGGEGKINSGNLKTDSEIQKIADDVLTRALQRTKATAGFIIVADPNTGKILAVANMDNAQKRAPHWILGQLMETASIAKAFTMAKALESGVTSAEEKHNCENGKYIYHGVEYRDWKQEGWKELTTSEAFENSSNICNMKVGEKVGEKNLMKMLEDFGFGAGGSAESFPEARVGERPTPGPQFIPQVTIGFGFKSSPLEVVAGFGAIANGGELMKPMNGDEKSSHVVRRVMTEEKAERMRMMLASVVMKGTGRRAKSDLYTTAGKTATSRFNDVVNSDNYGGKDLSNYAGFIGFAPVSHPQIEVYVGIINPNTDGSGAHGGEHAAPVFKEVIENILTHLKVTPDKF
jgi:beta-lactamase regulating signal transducer with metallopeptidase domain